MRRLCLVCTRTPARRLKSNHYAHSVADAVFCSRRCAAEYGLLMAGGGSVESIPVWCRACGTWGSFAEGDVVECFGCGSSSSCEEMAHS